jgi:DNA-binding NarL/FixJ family response regulator
VAVHALDPISREGVLHQLRRHPEIEVREEAETEPGTVALFVHGTFDDAVQTRLRRVVRGAGARAVLVVSALLDAQLMDVIECGVDAVVWRHEATEERLVQAIVAAARGDANLPAGLLGRLIRQLGGEPGCPTAGFTPRELDVLRLLAEGRKSGEIAAELSCSERTVTHVVYGITSRLQLRNREQAVAYALRGGYI